MNRQADATADTTGFGVLVALKLTILRNLLRQAIQQGPLKVAVSVTFLGLIWAGLFALFYLVFQSFRRTPLEAAVVIPVIYNIFFLALLVLLGFSNAVIAYGSLFGRAEPGFLLAAPVKPTHLVLIKYLESLFFSSWALVLLGLPLMMAMAESFEESWAFYPMFLAFFLFFVPIPGALGLILAYLAARFLPGRGERTLMAMGAAIVLLAALWSLRVARAVELVPQQWTAAFFERMGFVQAALLPSTWVSRGIEQVLRNRPGEALGYLTVTLANALFVSWVAVQLCGRRFLVTYNRATSGGGVSAAGRLSSAGSAGLCGFIFFYLPERLRLIAAKDLRTFLRDPLQWSQLVVLFGLMGLYLLNMPRFYTEFADASWGLLLPFLNLCAVTLMLATFTSRFVFPLVSLEGQQLWLLGLLPLRRGRILWAKFAYAATVTVPIAVGATLLAGRSMHLNWQWGILHLGATLAACLGLCGLAVGLGARLPLFGQRDPGRIANGFGGTVNLVASVALVAVLLAGMALASARARRLELTVPDEQAVLLVAGASAIATAAATLALYVGGRHFNRMEV